MRDQGGLRRALQHRLQCLRLWRLRPFSAKSKAREKESKRRKTYFSYFDFFSLPVGAPLQAHLLEAPVLDGAGQARRREAPCPGPAAGIVPDAALAVLPTPSGPAQCPSQATDGGAGPRGSANELANVGSSTMQAPRSLLDGPCRRLKFLRRALIHA